MNSPDISTTSSNTMEFLFVADDSGSAPGLKCTVACSNVEIDAEQIGTVLFIAKEYNITDPRGAALIA